MNRLKALLLSFVLIVSLAAQADAKSYVNGIDANYPPFGFVNEKGEPDGFDVRSMDWIAKKMGFKISHKPMDWDGIIPSLLADKIDMIASGMSITPARLAQVNFSNPYWIVQKVFVVKENANIKVEDVYKDGFRLAVQRGTNEHDFLENEKKAKKHGYTLRYYDSSPLAIDDLLNGRVQAVALDALPAKDAMSKGKAIKIIGTFSEDDEFGVAVRKEDKELLNMINEGYKLLLKDPYWQELQDTFLSKD